MQFAWYRFTDKNIEWRGAGTSDTDPLPGLRGWTTDIIGWAASLLNFLRSLRIPSLFVSRFLSFSLSFFLSFFHFLFLSFSTSFFFSGVVFKPSFFTSSLFLVQFHEPRVYFASSRVSSSHSRSLISLFRIRFIDYQPSSTGFVEFWTNRVALLFCNSLFWCAARWS